MNMIIIMTIFININVIKSNQLQNLMNNYEEKLYKMAEIVKLNNCNQQCNQCIMDSCKSQLSSNDGFVSSDKFGKEFYCNSCEISRMINLKSSSFQYTDFDFKSQSEIDMKNTACWTSKLDESFIYNFNNDSTINWQYFGTPSGNFRIYPGVAQEKCGDYDNRIRPWYVQSVSGAKDIIIILDISGSMLKNNKHKNAISALKVVINTLTINDYFNIILFSNNAYSLLGNNDLYQATNENIKLVLNKISQINFNGETNIESGFHAAYDSFNNAIKSEKTSDCNQIIIFISDGSPTVGLKNNELEEYITKNNKKYILFVFSLGSNADQTFCKNIACKNNGIWNHIEDNSASIVSQISYYYNYISYLREDVKNIKVVWSEQYLDAKGSGLLTTASLAVYSSNNLIGVLGIDILMNELIRIEPNYNDILNEIRQRSNINCPKKLNLDPCKLELIRKKNYIIDQSDNNQQIRTCTNLICNDSQNESRQNVQNKCNILLNNIDYCPIRKSFHDEACVKTNTICSNSNNLFNNYIMNFYINLCFLLILLNMEN